MKYLTFIIALFILFFVSCTKVDDSLPNNIFSNQEFEGLFEDISLVYLDGENKARISYEVNFEILSAEQESRVTGFYVDYNGTPRTFEGINRRAFEFPVPLGEEICVSLGIVAIGVLSDPNTPTCRTF